jgi:hypothetical protein
MRRYIIGLLICFGCGADSSYGVGVSSYGGYAYADPDLAYVGPDVYAVANYGRPVFYSNNYYWLYDNGLWYRSAYYTGGWARAYPPTAVLRIERPWTYRNYRPDRRYTRYYTPRDRYYPRSYNQRTYYDRRYYQRDRYTPRTYSAPRQQYVPRQYTPRREVPRSRVEVRRDRHRDDRYRDDRHRH